jgi:cobalamin biosynthesis protein CbiG
MTEPPQGDLVVGLGARPGVRAADARATVRALLARLALVPAAVRAYATLDARAAEPGLLAVAGPALLAYPAEVLARVPVPNPSALAAAAVGSPSVAEAAALHAAAELAPPGAEVELVGEKLAGAGVTAAVARIRPGGTGPWSLAG